ncbi:MAG: 30S ribosomal protein S21 [bacterium]|nr:30S ribosomal protein S21 [bacterium]
MIEVKKREGETSASAFFRFSKRVKQSGILTEVRKRRFYKRVVNKRVRRQSAKHRSARHTEIVRLKKMGLM